jgi:hypothetical protein
MLMVSALTMAITALDEEPPDDFKYRAAREAWAGPRAS